MSTTTILIHRFMKTKHKLLKLIHQLGDTFDGAVNFFSSSNSKGNGPNFKRILIRPTIKAPPN